ncbi:uncharacterized protein IL334_000766 [Kwoniella shivajii]|uniref:Uncharacterized protein n=1 Tax=Kwoniella shivajii TaxID=564305 RepID=A0ABZ1CQ94_9TREE|nr:hypothetical protein IL334_000766 [Kwoniella shivajii]
MYFKYVLLSFPLLLSSTLAGSEPTATWPAESTGCNLDQARSLYSSQSARLGGQSTTVIMGFSTSGAVKPTDQCEDTIPTKRSAVLENGHAAYIAPTGGPYGMSK